MNSPESIQAKINELKLQRSMLDVQKEMVSFRIMELKKQLDEVNNERYENF